MMFHNVKQKAEMILAEYGINTFPVPIDIIEQIIIDLGYEVLSFKECDKSCVVGTMVILGNKEEEWELRLSMAHELAHIVLHATNQTAENNIGLLKEESQAEAFVLYFLAPEEILKENIEYMSMFELCELFGMNKDLLKKRIKYYRKNNKNVDK